MISLGDFTPSVTSVIIVKTPLVYYLVMVLLKDLQNLGLTEYESKIYLALVKSGELKAGELSKISGVPYSKTYEIASMLEKKKIISVFKGRPMRFKALSPSTSLHEYASGYIEEIESGFQKKKLSLDDEHRKTITSIKESLEESSKVLLGFYSKIENISVSNDSIWTIKGRNNIANQIKEMVSKGKKVKMILNTELRGLLPNDLSKSHFTAEVILQGAKIERFSVPGSVNLYYIKEEVLEFGLIIADDTESLFVTESVDLAFQSSNKALVTMLSNIFEHEKGEAEKI